MGTLTPLPQRVSTRDAAHEAITDAVDLIGNLNVVAQYPRQLTESDREVLRHRLKCLNESVGKVIG